MENTEREVRKRTLYFLFKLNYNFIQMHHNIYFTIVSRKILFKKL